MITFYLDSKNTKLYAIPNGSNEVYEVDYTYEKNFEVINPDAILPSSANIFHDLHNSKLIGDAIADVLLYYLQKKQKERIFSK